MPLYLGLDAGAHGLHAIVIEIEGERRRVVFNRTINFESDVPLSYVADALDRMFGPVAAAAAIEVEPFTPSPASASRRWSAHRTCPDSRRRPSSLPAIRSVADRRTVANR